MEESMKSWWTLPLVVLGGLVLGLLLAGRGTSEEKKVDKRVFELRTYYAKPGKMNALHARFRNHTTALFKKHGMEVIAYWSPIDPADAEKRMIYVLAYPSYDAAKASWKAFQADPDWQKAKKESEVDGVLVDKVDSVFMTATDYSPMK
jgi:hypothetical protein